jgi:hypothetical protein
LNDIQVSGLVECQFKMANVQGDQAPTKRQKIWKKFRELNNEDRRRTIHELADTAGISYGVSQEILTKNLNMRRIAPRDKAPAHTSLKTTEFQSL